MLAGSEVCVADFGKMSRWMRNSSCLFVIPLGERV